MNLAPGAALGPYTIIGRVGRGGMASIYKAYQPALERYVAIKVLPDNLADEPGFRQRFHQEAVAVARLRHSNILTIYDHGEQDGRTYIVTEFIDGGTLHDLLGKPLPPAEVARLLAPIAAALDYAHGMGVIHRDVKPSNILMSKSGSPVLSDFGLAKMMESKERLTATGTIMGTPEYMAPEQCAGDEPHAAADIYSLGVIAYEMLTGRVPFSAATPAAVLIAQIQGELPLPRTINPDLAPRVEEVLMKVLAKSPSVRYGTATEMVDAIEAAAAPPPSPAPGRVVAAVLPAVTSLPSLSGRPMARPRWGPILLIVVLLVALVGGVVVYLERNQAGGNLVGATRSPSPSVSPSASPSPSPTPVPLHAIPAKGALIWSAALNGNTADVQEPRQVNGGAPTDSAITIGKGYMEFDVLKPGGGSGYNLQMPRLNAFVGEIDVAFSPGSDVFLWWSLTKDPQPATGGYALYVDASNQTMSILHQRITPPPDFRSANVPTPGLQKGTKMTIAVVINGQTIQLYLNQRHVLDVKAKFTIGAMNGQLFINGGFGGSFRITGIRYYALPV